MPYDKTSYATKPVSRPRVFIVCLLVCAVSCAAPTETAEKPESPSIEEETPNPEEIFARQVETYLEQLGDEEWAVRKQAHEKLMKMGSKALPHVMEKSKQQIEDPHVAVTLKQMLCDMRLYMTQEMAETGAGLLARLRSDDKQVVVHAFSDIAALPDRDSADFIMSVLVYHKSNDLRVLAAECLEEVADSLQRDDLEKLVELLRTDQCWEIQKGVWEILGDRGDLDILQKLAGFWPSGQDEFMPRTLEKSAHKNKEDAVNLLVKWLVHSNGVVARESVNVLGSLGDKSAVPYLAARLKDRNFVFGDLAIYSLIKLEAREHYDLFVDVLKNSEDEMDRAAAVHAVGKFGNKSAIDHLLGALTKDRVYTVRRSAAWELHRFPEDRVVDALAHALKTDVQYQVGEAALAALVEMDTERGLTALLKELKESKFPGCREKVAGELINFEPERVIESLTQALKEDKDVDVRRAAAASLGELGSDKAVPQLLLTARNKKDKETVACALAALGKIGIRNDEVQTILLDGLKDTDTSVQQAAAFSLGLVGDKKGLVELEKACEKSEDREVRFEIVQALALLNPEKYAEKLLKFGAWTHWEGEDKLYVLLQVGNLHGWVRYSELWYYFNLPSNVRTLKRLFPEGPAGDRLVKESGREDYVVELHEWLEKNEERLKWDAKKECYLLTTDNIEEGQPEEP